MQCRNCGTEIADKAIICYRCGAGTTDPVRKPAPLRAKRAVPLSAIILPLVLLLPVLYIAQTVTNSRAITAIGVALVALSAVLVVIRVLRRR